MVCHIATVCPALAKEAWDEVNLPSPLKTKASDLGSSPRITIFFCLFSDMHTVFHQRSWWIHFKLFSVHLIGLNSSLKNFKKHGCRNLVQKKS